MRRALLVVTALSVTVVAHVVMAQGARAQTPGEAACRAAIGKNVGKYTTAALKTAIKCHRKRSVGKITASVDCNDIAQADPNGKLDSKRAKLVGAITSACSGETGLLAQYARCPTPAHTVDDGDSTDGIDTVAELGDCMVGLVDGLAGKAALEAMGGPTGQLTSAAAKCQKTLGISAMKLLKTYFKVRVRCQRELDSAGQGLDYGCDGADDKQKIARSASKLALKLDKRCNLADPRVQSAGNEALDVIGACGDTLAQLKTCLADDLGERLGSGMVAMAYELPADCNAGGYERTVFAGFGQRITATQLGAGSNGIAHSIDFADGFTDPLSLDCDTDCANCALGFDTSTTRTVPMCRCSSNIRNACDTINGPDADDCGGSSCQCRFGPPLATLAAGNPACVDIQVTNDYQGSVDLGTGHLDNPLTVNAVIYLGLDTTTPCPVCTGDVTPNDGIRDGACSGGAQNGQPCDVNGTNPVFGGVSVDCQPPVLTNISGAGLPLNFELISADQELPHTLPCETPNGELCPCRTCSEDASIGCRSDDECPPGTGTCTGSGGAGISKNGCSDFVCNDDFRCQTGPTDNYCSSPVKPNGEGLFTCNTNFDCSGGATCTLQEKRRCYPDPITVGGQPGLFRSDVGGLACIGATTSAVINLASGLPGPVRVALHYANDVTCESDPTQFWNPPGGSNCATVMTTTTTTLFPPTPCVASLAPTCDGSCPMGEVCDPVPPGNVTCQCNPVTTTTLPASCGDVFPICGVGTCPPGETCQLNGTLDGCECTTGTACADTSFPICGGECPIGQSCQGDTLGQPCSCSP